MTQNGIVLVASVSVIRDGKVLIIKENKSSVRNQWNFPSGRIEPGEDILAAACREVKEETGYDVKLTETTGVYNFVSSTNDQVIMFHFIGEITGGSLQFDMNEIIDSKWVMISDFMITDRIELRNADVIKQIAENLMAGKFYPLTFFNQQLVK
ncbi:NUDIX hydrolase [Paenibacillus caui]|uniref:NUDIX hydrolase n=1 Tax=Paenibacillus caui TaxID=2873927 RepID=UPI001CAA1900|nr:NUDIX domain-containing protein [Paenibacillus caui]